MRLGTLLGYTVKGVALCSSSSRDWQNNFSYFALKSDLKGSPCPLQTQQAQSCFTPAVNTSLTREVNGPLLTVQLYAKHPGTWNRGSGCDLSC